MVSRYIFNGSRMPRGHLYLQEKWGIFFQIFLAAVNRENGSLGIDPIDAISYPAVTFQVLLYIQSLFIHFIKEENEKAASKARRR